MSKKNNGAFSVVFDIHGEPIDIVPGPGCKLLAEEPATSDGLNKILDMIKEDCGEEQVSTVGCQLINVHNSPGCYILTASGRLICICCR